ncbi:MAG TPA: 16S rRNA (cytidine(1402)-2'-O)-methyltransferase [Magnetospirillaceae bacterium]|jgi:16S rRNA (cytidine1402-2'-O)-methyltransferase
MAQRRDEAGSQPSEGTIASKSGADVAEPKSAQKSIMKILSPGLYLVSTPIGNLGDMTKRALDTLAQVELVACEDTRMTGKLLTLLGVKASLTPYHEHNAERARPAIIARLQDGAAVALVSDAGTPLLSDPGYRLVRACLDEGLPVTSVPGASAVLPALQLSGLPSDRFFFAGFLPNKTVARRKELGGLASVPATLVFYESPQRLAESLADMAEVLGARDAAVARELTKLHEETRRGTLAELTAHYAAADTPKGEIVIVIGPPADDAAPDAASVDAMLTEALRTLSVREAAAQVTAMTGLPRRVIYTRALELQGRKE